MGIIKASITAAESLMDDAWLELYYCDAMSQNQLMVHASKRTNPKSANHGTPENVISRGSRIIVNEGQAAIVVSDGKVIACYTDPGSHTFDGGYEGGLLKEWGRRIAFGGDNISTQQAVYFVNLHESMNHKFIVHAPVMVKSSGAPSTVTYVLEGAYCYSITDPQCFYRNRTGNLAQNASFSASFLSQTFDSEFISATAEVVSRLSDKGLDILSLSAHSKQLCAAIREQMQNGTAARCGIGITSVLLTSVNIGAKDLARHQKREDRSWVADSLPRNRSRAYYQKHEDLEWIRRSAPAVTAPSQPAVQTPPPSPAETPAGWRCACGTENLSKFCENCGKPRPVPWKCTCGQEVSGKFCEHCGKPRPEPWVCSCGTENFSNFCENCGKPRIPDDSRT